MLAIQDEIKAWIENSNSSPLDIARGRISVIVNRLPGSLLELSLTMASARLESIVMKATIVTKSFYSCCGKPIRLEKQPCKVGGHMETG